MPVDSGFANATNAAKAADAVVVVIGLDVAQEGYVYNELASSALGRERNDPIL